MNISLDCLSCFVRQALDVGRQVSDDPVLHEKLMRGVLRKISDADYSLPPPVLAQQIHHELRTITGVADPYKKQKLEHNELALNLLPKLMQRIANSDDPLICAARFAVAGNVIDLGAKSGADLGDVLQAVEFAMQEPLNGDIEAFRDAVANAEKILYLGDNSGEIVLDRLLIEQLQPKRVTFAVRGGPVINDVTEEDAQFVGLHEMVTVIGNGADVPGTDLDQCSEEFREVFNSADLIISKGQGNFETLCDHPCPIYFLFKVKCSIVAKKSSYPEGSHVLVKGAV
jgi:damage-control phosphatase, subfamily I